MQIKVKVLICEHLGFQKLEEGYKYKIKIITFYKNMKKISDGTTEKQ